MGRMDYFLRVVQTLHCTHVMAMFGRDSASGFYGQNRIHSQNMVQNKSLNLKLRTTLNRA